MLYPNKTTILICSEHIDQTQLGNQGIFCLGIIRLSPPCINPNMYYNYYTSSKLRLITCGALLPWRVQEGRESCFVKG